jgi:hypothetical protein
MIKQTFLLALALVASGAFAQYENPNTVRREGYVTKNGTYVEPSYATKPNDTKLDNYSTKGNVNPYTGKEGTKDPYAVQPVNPTESAPKKSLF